jgi:hypothetical protein
MESGYYPPGAELDPTAPYNEKDDPYYNDNHISEETEETKRDENEYKQN